MYRVLCLLAAFFLSMHSARAADRWPEWRGETGQGISLAKNLPVRWSEERGVVWKTNVPGRGWSTPVIDNGQIWLTTAHDEPASQEEVERRRKATTNSQPLIISKFVSLRAVCVDLDRGTLLRDVEVLSEQDPDYIHRENTYATPTPILENGRLYCHYGPCGIACLDTDSGKVLWNNRNLRVKHENGPGSSPVLWQDKLFIHCDGIDEQYVVALNKNTGEIAWKTKRSGKLNDNPQLKKSYATPLVTQVNGEPQLVSPAADWVYGYDLESGKELWRLNYGELGFSNAARPVAGNGLLYIATGYMKARMLAVRVTKNGDQQQAEIAWRYTRQVPNVSSPLVIGEMMYFVSDQGIASCLDARTGEAHWTQRIGKRFWASPLYAGGRIYFFDRDGTTTVIAAGNKYQRLAINKLDGEMLATAAAVDNALVLRTDKALYRLQ